MRREIKFRVWNVDREEWAEYGTLDLDGNFTQSGVEYHNYRYVVVQYTGLKDKNGKEIYEGDVLGYDNPDYSSEDRGVVEFGDFNCSCCNGVFGYTLEGADIRNFNNMVVIGNIYENPNLIKDNK